MREPESPGDSQKGCNEVAGMSWIRVVSAGRDIPHGCLYQRRTDLTVRRSWGRRGLVDKASALGHCLDCEEANEL